MVVSENVGNLFTIRPTYRWSGGRVLNEVNWKYLAELLNKLNIKYVHMTDGRELPGGTANPTLKMLEGKGFLGRQSHEYDGAFGYWGHGEINGLGEFVADYWMRLVRNNIEIANTRAYGCIIYVLNTASEKCTIMLDPYNVPEDMEDAAKLLVENFRDTRVDLQDIQVHLLFLNI